jgi:hypothetical protein
MLHYFFPIKLLNTLISVGSAQLLLNEVVGKSGKSYQQYGFKWELHTIFDHQKE